MKYIDTNKNRLITSLIVSMILMIALAVVSPWNVERIIESIVTFDEALIIPILYVISYIFLFLLNHLSGRLHKGWMRVSMVLFVICGCIGGFIAYDGNRGFDMDDAGEIFIGFISGIIISLIVIEIIVTIYSWIKDGFNSQN